MKPNWAAIGAALIAITLVVILIFVVFVPNPTERQNRIEIALQSERVRKVICAQAQSTANAFRFRQAGPTGQVEDLRHYLTRMQAQRQTLELSQGLGCVSAPGFPPFNFQVERALREINEILRDFTQAQKEPVQKPMPLIPPELETPGFSIQQPEATPGGIVEVGESEGTTNPAPKAPPPFQIPRQEPPPESPALEAPALPVEEPQEPTEEAPIVNVEPACSLVKRIINLC